MKKFILLALLLLILFFGCAGNNVQQTNDQTQQVDNMTKSKEKINYSKDSSKDIANTIPAKQGDTVLVDYLGTLDNSTAFDTSIKEEAIKAKLPLRSNYQPLQFTIGQGTLIPGFENGIIGMKEGEDKTVRLNPNEAYGELEKDLIVIVNKTQLSKELLNTVIIGGSLTTSNGARGVITNVSNSTITVDFNHPLAGKTLTFKLFLRKILNK